MLGTVQALGICTMNDTNTLAALRSALCAAALALGAKFVAMELAELFARADVLDFEASFYAGSPRLAATRREVIKALEESADFATMRAGSALNAGDVEKAARLAAVSRGLGAMAFGGAPRVALRRARSSDDERSAVSRAPLLHRRRARSSYGCNGASRGVSRPGPSGASPALPAPGPHAAGRALSRGAHHRARGLSWATTACP